ncbi:hypothetical protein DW646_19370, partial [Bacteroides sp. AM23-18]
VAQELINKVKSKCCGIKGNFAHRIYLSELKRVRRITSSLGNELATVLITVCCIALLVRITLSEGKGTKSRRKNVYNYLSSVYK